MEKILTWAAVNFVVFYLVTEPTSQGHLVSSAFHGLADAGNSLAGFVHSPSW